MSARVMVVDDDESFSSAVKRSLTSENIETICVSSPAEALRTYQEQKMNFDLLIVDWEYRGIQVTGSDLALQIKIINPYQALVFATGHDGGEEMLVSMLEAGTRSFIRKGKSIDKQAIIRIVKSTLKDLGHSVCGSAPDTLEEQERRAAEIMKLSLRGQSVGLYEIVKTVNHVKRFKSRFLIAGDSGAGKEKIAKAFQISGKPFYAVDCTKSEQFFESELYGHVKGAFTGADGAKAGILERANGGVVFFDELQCLSISAQSKLLRTLQEMKCRRLGDTSDRELHLDFTVVSAAQPIIYDMIERGEFKKDLYHRLAKSVITIPPLSARKDDIRPLALYFFEHYSRLHKVDCQPHPQLLNDLEAHSWPGNVRQLENFVEESIMRSKEAWVGPDAFRRFILRGKAEGLLKEKIKSMDLSDVVNEKERSEIIDALMLHPTIGETADFLNIPRTTLNDRMKRLGINPHHYLGKGMK